MGGEDDKVVVDRCCLPPTLILETDEVEGSMVVRWVID
jgi:hypothetical protein